MIVGLFLIVVTGSSVSPSSAGVSSENGAAGVEPVLRLEKPRYVKGEAIRFWVGVAPKNSIVIPEELRKPCSLSITKPDGAGRVESAGWPVSSCPTRCSPQMTTAIGDVVFRDSFARLWY